MNLDKDTLIICNNCQNGDHSNHTDGGFCANDNRFNSDCRCDWREQDSTGGQMTEKLDVHDIEIAVLPDWADEKAAELLPCQYLSGGCAFPERGHKKGCPAHYRPAVAAALREARVKALEEVYDLWDSRQQNRIRALIDAGKRNDESR